MNVDENREIPAKFGIRGIPTLMLFKDGQLAATKVGAHEQSATRPRSSTSNWPDSSANAATSRPHRSCPRAMAFRAFFSCHNPRTSTTDSHDRNGSSSR
jgi:thiol-disulfide isomerase/thioredoxin